MATQPPDGYAAGVRTPLGQDPWYETLLVSEGTTGLCVRCGRPVADLGGLTQTVALLERPNVPEGKTLIGLDRSPLATPGLCHDGDAHLRGSLEDAVASAVASLRQMKERPC